MIKKWIGTILFVILVLTLGIFGCSQQASAPTAKKVIKIGCEPTFPPFEFQDKKTQEYIGFDIDLAKAVFKRAGYDTEIVNIKFDGLIPSLHAKNIDAIVSAMQITEERAKKVAFSEPYYESGQGIVVRIDNETIHSWKDIEGKTIGVQIGTTGASEAHKVPNAIVKEYDHIADAYLDLKAGRIESVVSSVPVNAYYIANGGGAKDAKMVGEIRNNLFCGIAMNKDDKELIQKTNKALAEIKQNGEYDKIYEKWFGKKQ